MWRGRRRPLSPGPAAAVPARRAVRGSGGGGAAPREAGARPAPGRRTPAGRGAALQAGGGWGPLRGNGDCPPRVPLGLPTQCRYKPAPGGGGGPRPGGPGALRLNRSGVRMLLQAREILLSLRVEKGECI